jgi:hypothetical protein
LLLPTRLRRAGEHGVKKPMIETIIKLHKTDFVIYEAFLLILFCCWYWALFMGGAKKWSKGIIQFWGKLSFLQITNPTILKIFITISLLAVIVGGYGIIINKIRTF